MGGAAVVYVHGLWMPGLEVALLARRLRRERGYRVHVFHYRSVTAPLSQVLRELAGLIERLEAPRVHLLGHSLGGLVILRLLERHPSAKAGRVVLLGTPCGGSRAARQFARLELGRRMLGQTACEQLLSAPVRLWPGTRELGIIAGTAPIGLGHLLVAFHEPSDGTIAVSETELPGASSLRLPVSHSGMLLSARVAREAGSFLEHGRFGL